MKAAVVTERGVEVREVEKPKPGPEQVLVRVRAAGLNRADLGIAAGHAHGAIGGTGTIVGLEFAGGRRQQRVVVQDGAAIIVAGNIHCGEHGAHARRGAHRVQLQGAQAAMRTRGLANGGVQGASQLGQVVQIVGGAADVQQIGRAHV